MRISARTAHKKPDPRKIWDDDLLLPSYLDTIEFKAYSLMILSVLKAAADPLTGLTVGDIKRALGDKYIPEWFCDAIEALDDVEEVPFSYPTRFRMQTRRCEPIVSKDNKGRVGFSFYKTPSDYTPERFGKRD